MLRRALLVVGGALAAVVLTGAAFGAVVLATAPGHRLARRFAAAALAQAVDGTVRIGEVHGALWRAADVRDVALATRDGQPVIRADRVRVSFALADLVRGRYRLRGILLSRPVVVLEQRPDGRWNIEELFRLGRPDSGLPGRRPLVDLRDVTVADGAVIVRERPSGRDVVERTVTGLNAVLSRLLASHPDSGGVAVGIRSLAARLGNPAVEVRGLAGEVALNGDSVRFALERVALPRTVAAARGQVRWGGPHVALDLAANAPRLAFADLAGLVRRLPRDGGGRVDLSLRLPGDGSARVDIRRAELRSGRSVVRGSVGLTVGPDGGIVLRDARLEAEPLDLALLAPWLDTLPARGELRGRVTAGGSVRDLALDGDVRWSDAEAGGVVSYLAVRGRVAFGGRAGLEFRGLTLRPATVPFATIRRYVPTLDWNGRLRLDGRLEGPWRRPDFNGRVMHLGDPDLATAGMAHLQLTLESEPRLDLDIDLDSLSLALLARTYPGIPVRGVVAGKIGLHGPVSGLAVAAALKGPGGGVTAVGTVGSRDGAVSVDLAGTFDSLDAAVWRGELPPTALWGLWSTALRIPGDRELPVIGTSRVTLRPSRIAGLAVPAGAASLRFTEARLELDSMVLQTAAGPLRADGSIGRARTAPGATRFVAQLDTVAYVEPLLRWAVRRAGDTAVVRLDGAGVLRGRVTGSLPAWQLQLAAGLSAVDAFGVRVRAARVQGQLAWDSAGLRLDLSGAADTLAVGDLVYGPVGAAAQGVPDSMSLRLSAGLGRASGVAAALGIWGDSARRFVRVDSLALDLAVGRWRLVRPAVLVVDREAVSVDTVDLRPVRGGGRFLAEGSLPRGGVGDFVLRAESLPVVDLLALAGHDTTATGGALDLVLRVAGPAATPSMEGSIALREGRSGDFRAPLAEMLVRYVDRRLTLKGGLWRDTVRVIALSGSLPLDLALEPVPARRLPGALQVAARSDSVDLAVLDPLIDVVSGLTGTLTADAGVSGTWERPTLAGHLEVHRGTVTVPALGARYTGLDARLDLDDAGITVTRARAQAGGAITIGGRVRTAGERATLDLTVRADNFAAFDVPDLGSLTATGDLTLRGPVLGATLAGSLRVDRGTLRFADLVEKEIVSLDDPEFRAIVDSNLAAAAALGPEFRTVFVDSLRIDGLTLTMGPDVWLRSSEASIQLDGEFRVDKQVEMGLPRYRFDGTLRANRGVYRLVLGPVNSPLQVSKDFRVTRGTVRFFGMPDFDPAMDIVAEHQLRTAAGSPMLVRALISGTLRSPQLRLESDERPPLNETEIVSYMLFGRPPSDLTQSQAGGGEMAVLQSTVGGVAGGFGQALLSDLGLPLDYLTLQTGSRRSSDALGLSSARIGAGLQLGDRTFLTLTAGVCEVMTSQLIGAGVEYRLASRWTATAAFEPLVRECGVASSLSGLSARYQLSFDVLWRQGTR